MIRVLFSLFLYLITIPVGVLAQQSHEAIFVALHRDNMEKVQMLLEDTKDIETRDGTGNTLLMEAARHGHVSLVRYLLDRQAKVNADNGGFTALMQATNNGHIAIVELLLARGARINAYSDDGETALILAASGDRGNTEQSKKLVQVLLSHGADPNRINKNGETALMVASKFRQTEIASLLMSKKAALNVRNKEGNTALHFAVASKVYITHIGPLSPTLPLVQLLVSRGASVHIKNKAGETALMIAIKDKHAEIAKLLRKAEAKRD